MELKCTNKLPHISNNYFYDILIERGITNPDEYDFRELPNNKIAMVGFIWHKHIDDLIQEIYEKMVFYKARQLHMEENADKGSSLQKILAHPLSKTYSILGNSYNESQNKQVKIATHLHDRWYHILWSPDTHQDYLNQICDWTENSKDFDDAPDSAASLLREAGFTNKSNWRNLYK